MEALGILRNQHDRYEEAYTLRWIAIAQQGGGTRRARPPRLAAGAAEDASTRR